MSPSREVSTSALLRLLTTGDPEQQCGAALVLGALTPTDRRVVPALGRALDGSRSAVRPYILDALGEFDDPRTFRYIAPFLFSEGSLREQAVRLLQARGAAVLHDLIRFHRRNADRTDTAAFFRVMAHIEHEEAVDFVVSQLASSAFEQARNVAQSLKKFGPRYPTSIRKHLIGRLIDTLDELASTGSNPTAEIAIAKIFRVVHDARVIRPLLDRLPSDILPALRQNVLDALAEVPIPKARATTVTRRLLPLLHDDEPPFVVAGALRVLRRFEPFPLERSGLEQLCRSAHADVARVALRELVRFQDEDAVQLLLDALRRDESSVWGTAASTLSEMTEAIDAVVSAHEDPRFARHQETLRAILAAHAEGIDGAGFRRRVKALIDADTDEATLVGRLLALAAIDKAGLNRAVESRVSKALTQGDSARAVTLLEPLVRNRLASPRGRYLLALGHIATAGTDFAPGTPHHDRAMQLLSPLARVSGFRLKRHLVEETRVSDDALRAVAEYMSRRPQIEKDVAAALLDRLGDA